MNYLQVENLSKSFGDHDLFHNITFGIDCGQKVALIARNGAGKTTLLNIIAGKDIPDSGKVTFRNDLVVSYLTQDPAFNNDLTVLQVALGSSKEIIQTIELYEEAIVNHDKDSLGEIIVKMDALEAWDYEATVKQILGKLKINEFNKRIGELSGGQKKRIALANAIINEPDVMILDEPTNHLDLEMIEWLEGYLRTSKCTLLMVTHDRYFLDRVCDLILELDDQTIYHYKGNYAYFLEKRDERLVNEKATVDKARNLFRKELEWMRRQPKARGTKAKARIDSFYEVKDVAFSQRKERNLELDIKSTYLGNKIIEVNYINKKYGDLNILDQFTYTFKKYEKIGIVGNNGTGKSTFVNILTGKVRPDAGTVDVGESVVFGYFTQEGIQLDEDKRVIDVIKDIAEVISVGKGNTIAASQFLDHFLFSYKMQHTFVSKLSGGEKRRLHLLTVLMKNPNFLILDEPTNDLDIFTLNVLEDYLINFKGCVVVVSHDRYFMDKIADHMFVFEGNAAIKDFPGNYSDYRDYKMLQEKNKKKETKVKEQTERKPATSSNKPTYKQKKEFEELEVQIGQLEQEKKDVENKMSNISTQSDELISLSFRLGEIISLIDTQTNRWLELSEFME